MLHDPYAPIQNGVVGGEDNLAELQVNTLRELGHEVFDARLFDSGVVRKKINYSLKEWENHKVSKK